MTESQAEAILAKLNTISEGLEELLTDARRTRPLLDKYLNLGKGWGFGGAKK